MAEIALTRGLVVLVDDEDFEFLNGVKWHASPTQGGRFYAVTRVPNAPRRIKMHRFIMRAPRHMVVHHINNNGLDNRRGNLAIVTPAQNTAAHFYERDGGVYLDKAAGRYRAAVRVDRYRINLGLHDDREVAIRAVRIARELLPGLPHEEMIAVAERIKLAAKAARSSPTVSSDGGGNRG